MTERDVEFVRKEMTRDGQLWMILIGPRGAVQFACFPGGLPGMSDHEFGQRCFGSDVGYHSPTSKYDGQPSRACDVLLTRTCYYDGSSMRADDWAQQLWPRGKDAIWAALRAYYAATFESDEGDEVIGGIGEMLQLLAGDAPPSEPEG